MIIPFTEKFFCKECEHYHCRHCNGNDFYMHNYNRYCSKCKIPNMFLCTPEVCASS